MSESSEDTLSVSEDTDEPLEEDGDCKAMDGLGSRLLVASSPTFLLAFRITKERQ